MKPQKMNVKEKFLFDHVRVFENIKNEDLTRNEMAAKLNLPIHTISLHIKRLKGEFFITTPHNKTYLAVNVEGFGAYIELEKEKYLKRYSNNIRQILNNNIPLHIQEAIKRGLISPDAVHSHSPLEELASKFKQNERVVKKTTPWQGYSVYNMY